MKIQEKIRDEIKASPGFIAGFAHIEGLLDEQFKNYKYAISIGKKLDDLVIDNIVNGPTHQYYKLHRKTNEELESKLSAIGNILRNAGIEFISIKPTFEEEELDKDYYRTLRTPFSHKFAATRAGLGWIGKTDLLISNEFGPRLRLASILVGIGIQEFETSTPIIKSKCGNCDLCVTKCPAQAANGKLWNVGIDRDVFYDAFKCREKCRELSRNSINMNTSICGICISVCPIGRKKDHKDK